MILDDILAETRRTVAACRSRVPIAEMERLAAAAVPARSMGQSIRSGRGMGCIAEFKRRSPSRGWIHREADVRAMARAYEAGGAADRKSVV